MTSEPGNVAGGKDGQDNLENCRHFLKTNLGRSLLAAGVLGSVGRTGNAYPQHWNYGMYTNDSPQGGVHVNNVTHKNTLEFVHENYAQHTNAGNHANILVHENSGEPCSHVDIEVHVNKVQSHDDILVHTNRK